MKPFLAIILGTCAILCLTVDASPRSPVAPPTVQPAESLTVGCPCGADCQCVELRAKVASLEATIRELRTVQAVPVKHVPDVGKMVKQSTPLNCPNGVCSVPPRQYAAPTRRVVVSKPVRRGLLGRWR